VGKDNRRDHPQTDDEDYANVLDFDPNTGVDDMDEDCGLKPDYKLKLNSYDLGVDIELYDAVQRLRFEHPEVRSVVITPKKKRSFLCSIRMPCSGE